ncbi:MAG: N-6 DNA methylase [Bacteroidales bacterium]
MILENRIYQAYYTKSDPIVNYMLSLLSLNGSEKILEPCAGDGVFIDPIIKTFPDIKIDAYELNDNSYSNLLVKYSENKNIQVKKTDTLTDVDLEFLCSMGGGYDAIIANPPYGAWRDQEERKKLKRSYNGFYAKESYTLFLYRCIEALNEKGKLVFIIPDTYLNLHMHKDIRKYILNRTKIKEISLFPSSYFPGVNFGYANLSIISLEKSLNHKANVDNNFLIKKGFKKVEELGSDNETVQTITLQQKDVLSSPDYSFVTNGDKQLVDCFNLTKLKIGDICDCVTGFYSGNDKNFLKVRDKTIRNSKKYDAVNLELVEFNCDASLVDGITNEKEYVPIVKGGNRKYFKPDEWFMNWSLEKVNFFKKDKKARYQNSSYYFRKGIGVPMVSSSSITGALIENRLFDQSIVGIFPKDLSFLYYLLAFFNSPTCNTLIRTINSSTNNSSNYIKKIPIIIPNEKLILKINERIKLILNDCKSKNHFNQDLEELNNEDIKSLYGF